VTVDDVEQPLPGDLVRAIEAVLMVATEPVPPQLLAQLLEVRLTAVEDLCERLAVAYEEGGHGFQLVRVAGGYRFQSHPDLAPYVERFVLDGQTAKLSAAALETLAIVAYKQPISRAQIASIRGVDPDAVLRTLQARGYVDQLGRDTGPGQAVLWGTTDQFLEKLGLDSIADLPPLAGFVPDAEVVEALEQGLRPEPLAPDAGRPEEPAEH
jgi:segregation and condensation protein B